MHSVFFLLGTPFMVRLHEQLKFFVNYKISTDLAWQGLRIYLSGHEVCEISCKSCLDQNLLQQENNVGQLFTNRLCMGLGNTGKLLNYSHFPGLESPRKW